MASSGDKEEGEMAFKINFIKQAESFDAFLIPFFQDTASISGLREMTEAMEGEEKGKAL